MKGKAAICRALVLGALFAIATPGSSQRANGVAVLEKLEPGLWQLRGLGDHRRADPPLCLGDPNLLLQLEHRNSPCSRLVVNQDARSATVHYTCPAAGYGQTLLIVETPRLVRVDTQGIIGNRPFSYRVEARRVGDCQAGGGRGSR